MSDHDADDERTADRPSTGSGDDSPPIACTLTRAEKDEREAFIRETLFEDLVDVTETERGYRFAFRMGDETLEDVATWVRREADCCSFATFEVTVPPQAEQFTLEMTGPESFGHLVEADFLREFRAAAGSA